MLAGFVGVVRLFGLIRFGRLIGVFFEITIVAARYKVRNIVVIARLTGVFRITDLAFFRFHDRLFVIVSCGFYIVGNVFVRAILAVMYRITIRLTRSADRLFFVVVSDRLIPIHRITVAAVFANVFGITVFRTGCKVFFGQICVSRSGNVTIRIFIPALFAIMNGISAVRTGRFNHDFPEFMPVYLGIIVGVSIAAKRTGISRITFRSASAFHHLFRVFVRTLGYGFLFPLVCKRGCSARTDKCAHTRRQHYRRHDKF